MMESYTAMKKSVLLPKAMHKYHRQIFKQKSQIQREHTNTAI